MNLNKYTEKAQEALMESQNLAQRNGQVAVEPEHLLKNLAEQDPGLALSILRKAGIAVDGLVRRIDQVVEQLPKVVSVVRDKLVPPGSEHRSVAALKLSDEAWPVRIEGAVILTAYKVTVDMGVGASRQQRGERAPLHALGY